MNYLGDYVEDDVVYLMFNTFSSNDPSASCTITNFVNTDVHIHKDDGLTQRNNAAGITVSVDFDGITGSHMIKIDTSDNTVAGFWVVGHDYFVRIEGTTVDAAIINSMVGSFSIENRFMRGTDNVATVQDIVDGIFDRVTEGTLTYDEIIKIGFAVLAGVSSGGGTPTAVYRDVADAKARVTATITAAGNRTAITLDGA